MKNLKELKILFKLLKEEKIKLIIASIIIFVVELSEIATGYLNGAAVEAITNLLVKKALIYLAIYFVLSIFVDGLLSNIADSIILKIEEKLSRKMSYHSYLKSLNLPVYAYEETSSGEIINRINNDADALSFTFSNLIRMLSSIVGSIIILFYIFFNSWIVGIEVIIIVLLLFLVIRKYNPELIKIHKERKKEQDKSTSIVNESIRGVREIKTLGIKHNLLTDMKDVLGTIQNKSEKQIDLRKRFNLITRIIKVFLEIGVFATCVILIYYGKTTLTFFIAMTYYVYRYMYLIENINEFTQTYQKVLVSITRVNDLLEDRIAPPEKFGKKELNNVKGVIEFKNVSFSYPDEDLILKDFNIKLEPHKKIAIVGKSGQGKSTLFNLMTRIFDPTKGKITLDNVNIKDLTEESLRKNISIIRQDPFIFNRTIKENFLIVNENAELDDIRKYAKIAYIDDYIMSLPKQYDTILGEGGVNLSGGQKQRLAIARTLLKQSKVILFDEATSALDNNSQEYIKKAIDNLVKDHTVIIVAHRLSTIIDADIIYVVNDGKILASGKHKELLNISKEYKELYKNEDLSS